MALSIQSGTLATGEQKVHNFTNKVRAAGVSMQAYVLAYQDGAREEQVAPPDGEQGAAPGDHHIQEVAASTTIVSVSDAQVTVKVEGKLRDSSGHVGGGTITYTVIVDTD